MVQVVALVCVCEVRGGDKYSSSIYKDRDRNYIVVYCELVYLTALVMVAVENPNKCAQQDLFTIVGHRQCLTVPEKKQPSIRCVSFCKIKITIRLKLIQH